ncbi:MAG: START domain-containing protein [Pseudomonadota bacterium]
MKVHQLTVLLALLLPFLATAQQEGVDYTWEDKRNKEGILIQTSSVKGSPFKAVRGEMTVKATVSSLVALVEDLPACPEWAALCREARLEKRVSPTESYAYIYNDIPFPVSDRDVYTHVVWTQDPETGKVSMTSIATEGGTPKTKAVRLENAMSQWHFTPNGDGTTKVENFAHIDPNGPTPAWITNMMLVDSPFSSMTEMRKIVESGGYADAEVPFLVE